MKPIAPLTKGEPVRALWVTYLFAGSLVLLGKIDLVAPLLSMCFLVAYCFMNFSCFVLTWLKSAAWRPKGVQQKRWRLWYMGTGFCGSIICLTIMFTIDHWWALVALVTSGSLYMYINYTLEAAEWGSAMDGIRFQLALTSLTKLEESQHHHVNWRPQVLILYRVHISEELKGIRHHEILRFYSQLRKGNGFCVVAAVLEADRRDEHALHMARVEKDMIQTIMKQEGIKGFAEVVVAPTWGEGTNYIIQLTGIGGLQPNTVLMDWPSDWTTSRRKGQDFVNVVCAALAQNKAILSMKGLQDLPQDQCYGTIDIWWIVCDGGFLMLIAWLLSQHRIWRKCKLRVFVIAADTPQAKAEAGAKMLKKTLRKRQLFDVDVNVLCVKGDMISPYLYNWKKHLEERKKYLEQIMPEMEKSGAHMLAVDDLFAPDLTMPSSYSGRNLDLADEVEDEDAAEDDLEHIHITHLLSTDFSSVQEQDGLGSASSLGSFQRQSSSTTPRGTSPTGALVSDRSFASGSFSRAVVDGSSSSSVPPAVMTATDVPPERSESDGTQTPIRNPESPRSPGRQISRQSSSSSRGPAGARPRSPLRGPITEFSSLPQPAKAPVRESSNIYGTEEQLIKLNKAIVERSKRAQLVCINMPAPGGVDREEVRNFMHYCETLTQGIDRVLFVHSSGHEVFDLSANG